MTTMAVARVPTFQQSIFFRAAAAALCVLSAFLITTQVEAIAARTPFGLFYASVAIATWFGGRYVGFGTLVLSAIAGGYFILPLETGSKPDPSGLLQLATFVLVGLIFVFLTSRLKVGTALIRESEAQYRTLFEYSPYGILIADKESNYIDANRRMCGMLGYEHSELVGMNAADIVAPHETSEIDVALGTIRSGADHIREWQFRRKDGSQFLGEVVATEMPDGTLLGVVHDVTERERAEKDLRTSRERLKAVVDAALDGIIMMDHEGRIVGFNPSAERIFNYRISDVLGKNLADKIIPQNYREAHRLGLERFISTGEGTVLNKRLELTAMQSDGNEIPVELTISRVGTAEPPLFTGFVRDITQRKVAEQQLLESRKQFKELTESIPQMVWTCRGDDGSCDYLSPQWLSYTGLPADEQLGFGWLNQVHPNDRTGTMEKWHEAVESAGIFDVEFRIRRFDGEYRWFKTRAVPSRDDKGKIVKWIGSNTDIEDSKRAEEQIREFTETLELRIAERTSELELAIKELESFSYSVSHDLRAPLRHIDGFVKLLADRESERFDETSQRYVKVVSNAVAKMGILIDELLAFSRTSRREIQSARVDLNDLVKESLHVLEPAMSGRSINWKVAPLPDALGDPTLLGLVFSNLLSNAVKFTRGRSTAEIEIGSTDKNSSMTIYVKDNGVGFDMTYSKKLFGVFQRLHGENEFEGIGIGLATVQRVVNRLGGSVWADAEVDKGATFYFTLKKAGDHHERRDN